MTARKPTTPKHGASPTKTNPSGVIKSISPGGRGSNLKHRSCKPLRVSFTDTPRRISALLENIIVSPKENTVAAKPLARSLEIEEEKVEPKKVAVLAEPKPIMDTPALSQVKTIPTAEASIIDKLVAAALTEPDGDNIVDPLDKEVALITSGVMKILSGPKL